MKYLLALSLLVFATACKKNDPLEPPASGNPEVKIKITHLWDNNTAFELNTMLVNPLNGDSLNFTKFKYYLSNVRLQKMDGSWWKMDYSYFLVDLAEGSETSISLDGVPPGSYTAIQYTLGVDSLHNVSGPQTGALDPVYDMFWGWTSGYIMLKTEGTSPDIAPESFFSLHCAGYHGSHNLVTTVNHSFTSPLHATSGTKTVLLSCNPAYLWLSDGITTHNNIPGTGIPAKRVTSDFYSTFSFDGIE